MNKFFKQCWRGWVAMNWTARIVLIIVALFVVHFAFRPHAHAVVAKPEPSPSGLFVIRIENDILPASHGNADAVQVTLPVDGVYLKEWDGKPQWTNKANAKRFTRQEAEELANDIWARSKGLAVMYKVDDAD